jgi:hypothetical protein
MQALIEREQKAVAASAARAAFAGASGAAMPAAWSVPSKPKKEKKAKLAAHLEHSRTASQPAYADYGGGEDEEDESDEEFREHGYAVPVPVEDPRSSAEAAGLVGERVFLEGVRKDLNGRGAVVLGWLAQKRCWETECDVHDERLRVKSDNMMRLTGAREMPVAKPKKRAEPKPAPAKKIQKKGKK